MSLTKILLKEFQEKNYLYHFSSIDNASKIIDDNTINAGSSLATNQLLRSKTSDWEEFDEKLKNNETIKAVSLTRNRKLPHINKSYIGGMFGSLVPIGFVFDRNKLRSKYKLIPFDAHHSMDSEDQRVLDEELVLGDIDNVRQLTEFLYIDREHGKQTDMYEEYIRQLLKFYKTYDKYFTFKIFKKGNFKEVDIDISKWDGSLNFERGSIELQMYRKIFSE